MPGGRSTCGAIFRRRRCFCWSTIGGSLPPIALGPTAQSRLVALSLGELAADPRALLGVSHMILYDQSLRDLSRPQLLALDTWLSAGGRMVIIGSLNYALYQEPVIGRFLPVRVSGHRRIAFTPANGKDEKGVTIADVWAQVSAPSTAQVLAQSQGLPVLVEAARGRGKIIYLSLDIGRPPLSQWPGLAKFLQTLLAAGAVDEPVARAEWNDSIFTQLITVQPSFRPMCPMVRCFSSSWFISWRSDCSAGYGSAAGWRRCRQSFPCSCW